MNRRAIEDRLGGDILDFIGSRTACPANCVTCLRKYGEYSKSDLPPEAVPPARAR